MANTIKLKRGSGGDPNASDLVVGELAIRTDTAKLFTKKDNGSVVEILGSTGGGLTNGDKGDITVANNGDTLTVDDGVINNAKVASNAAIAGSKITPTFTTAISQSGGGSNTFATNIQINTTFPSIYLNDTDSENDFYVQNRNGTFAIRDADAAVNRFAIASDGTTTILNNLDVGAGIDVTGASTFSGGITSTGNLTCGHLSASTDGNTSISLQDTGHGFPASEIKLSNGGRDLNIVAPKDIRLFPQSGELGLVVEANGQVELYFDNLKKAETSSTGFDVTGNITATGTIGSSNITITNSQPFLSLQDSDNENDFEVGNAGGLFRIRDVDAAVNRLTIASDGTTTISSNLDVGAGLDVTGNLTISNSLPQIKLTDTDNNPDYALWNHDGVFRIVDASNSNATRFQIQQGGLVVVSNDFQVTGVITGTSHIDIPDNAKIKLGTDDDLNIFHDGSNGQIQNTTGNLVIETPILHVKTTGNPTLLLEDTDQSNQVGVRYKTTTLDWIAGLHGGINQWKISKSTAFGTNDYFILDSSGNTTLSGNLTVNNFIRSTNGYGVGSTTVISASRVLQNVTAATQSAGDNSTKLATTAYTDTAIANLVNSAPSTLDTLGEIATALNNDAALNTTLTNSIATKLPLTGGTLTGDLTISDNNPTLSFSEGDGNPDYRIIGNGGKLAFQDVTNSFAERLVINSDGHIDVTGNLDVGAGIDVTGDITSTGNLTISNTAPRIVLNDTDTDSDFRIQVASGNFRIQDVTNGNANRLSINSGGTVNIAGNLDVGAGIDVTGNIDITDGTLIIDTTPDSPNTSFGLQEAIRIDDAGGTADRGLNIYEYRQGGGRFFSLNYNLAAGSSGSAYTYTQGNYAGSTMLRFDSTYKFFVDSQVTSGSTDVITPTKRFEITTSGVEVTGTCTATTFSGSGASLTSVNAATLDSLDSTQFIRSDADDTATGALTFSRELTFSNDDDGIFLYGGGRFYKKSGSGVTIRLHDANTPLKIENNSGTFLGNVFHSGNDGAGSGLDSDTVDGIQASSFLRSDADDTSSGILTISKSSSSGINLKLHNTSSGNRVAIEFSDQGSQSQKGFIEYFHADADSNSAGNSFHFNSSETSTAVIIDQTAGNSGFYVGTNEVFHQGNDGAGSGLDSDKLDGQEGSYYADAASYVKEIRTQNDITTRFDSGFYETATATTGEGWPQTTNSWYHLIASTHSNTANYYSMQIAGNFFAQKFYIRNTQNSGTKAWSEIWTSSTDGSGSGLDADTLDGEEGSYYRNASNLNAGTIPAARVPTLNQNTTGSAASIVLGNDSDGSTPRRLVFASADTGTVTIQADTTSGATYTPSTGTITTQEFSGNGSGIQNLNASNLASGTIPDARLPNTITPSTLVSTVEVRTSNGQQLVLNAGESNGKVSGQTSEFVYVNAEQGLSVNTPDSANANWQGGSASDQTVIKGTSITIDGNTVFHQGNDGSGSGLDSDTLDGEEGSYYRNASNLNAGTVATSRLPFTYTKAGKITIQATGLTNDVQLDAADNIILESGEEESGAIYFRGNNTTSSYRFSKAGQTTIEGFLSFESLSADRTFTFPDTAGTIALTSSTVAAATNADTVDSLHASSFVRSDANDTATGQLTFSGGISTNGEDVYTNNGAFITNDADGHFADRSGSNIDHVWHDDGDNAWNFCSDTTYKNTGNSKIKAGAAQFLGDVTIGDGSGNTKLLIKKSDNNVADHIQFYNGTTRVGEIGTEDSTWLRINQETAKNIYTPRYIRADGGFFVDGSSKGINGSGNFVNGTIAGASDYGTLIRSDADDNVSGHTEWQDNYQVRFGNSADFRLYHNGSDSYMDNETGHIYIRNSSTNDNANIYIQARDGENSIICEDDADVRLFSNNTEVFRTDTTSSNKSKHLYPWTNNEYDLGSTSLRWRNLYVNDMHFSNHPDNPNSVDGTWGDWTLQEGESDIFMINNRTGKKFKIAMIPV